MKRAIKSATCQHCDQSIVTSDDKSWLHTDLIAGCRNQWREPIGKVAEPTSARTPATPVYVRPYRRNNRFL